MQRLLLVAATLTEHPSEATSLAGFTLLVDAVKSRWDELNAQEKAQITEAALRDVAAVRKTGGASWAIKSKVSLLLSAVIRQQGPEAYSQILTQLLNGSAGLAGGFSSDDALRDELSCLVLHFISEDLTHFDPILHQGASEATDANRRAFLSALSSSVESVFPFLSNRLEGHFMAAVACKEPIKAKAHAAVVSASLQALSAWVEWTPMARITSSNVLDACGFFLSSQAIAMEGTDFKMLAVDVLRQVSSRKRTSEGHEEYDSLMDKCGSVLFSGCQQLGFITQEGGMAPSVSLAVESEGSMEELGLRMCSTIVCLGENHFKCLISHGGDARRDAFLALILAFTRHPNLLVSTLTLPLWSSLLRDALPNIQGGSIVSPAAAAAAASSSAVNPSLPTIRQASIHVPPECCKSLMNVVVEQMPRVLIVSSSSAQNSSESGDSGEIPLSFNSPQDWKDFASSYKGHLKQMLRLATHLCPEHGLSIASESIRTAASAAASSAKIVVRRKMLETAAMVLESTVPPLADLSEHLQAASQGMETLMKQTIDFAPLAIDELGSVPLLARAYEAFARFIAVRPDLATHLISACLSLMKQVPLDEHGQMPPPVPVTPVWKKAFEARLGAASAISNLAKSAPAAFVPLLGPLVAEVQSLWAQGLLREGERVLIWEALLSSAVAAGPEAQSQVLAHILSPMAAQWTDASWRQKIATPQAFAASFLSLTPSPLGVNAGSSSSSSPLVSLGSRSERWTLYHQCTLLERAYRRSLILPSSQAHADPPPGGGPCSPHLPWSLPVVCQILYCLHGLWAPEMKQMLGPLTIVTEIDPRERAARLNDLEAAKEEPRCVAGASLHDARYFIRGCREACYMILSLVAQHCGGSLWNDASLQSLIVPSLCSSLTLTGVLDYSQLRLIHRHVLLPMASNCPPEMQATWTLPIVRVVIPSMCDRLARDWSENLSSNGKLKVASVSLARSPSNSNSNSPQEGGGGASEEVLADALLREATREYMELLFQVTRKPGDPPPSSRIHPYSQKQPIANTSPGISRAGSPLFDSLEQSQSQSQSQSQGARAIGSGKPKQPAGGGGGGEAQASDLSTQTVMDMIIKSDPTVAEAAMKTALMGLCWPDADSCSKAVSICKYFVNLASASFPQLEPFICNDMLRTGIISVSQVFTMDIQADVLALLRLIIFTFLLNRKPAPSAQGQVPPSVFIVRRSIIELLQLPDSTVEEFENQLAKTGSEKKQSALLKQLIASSTSNEQVRQLLSFRHPSDPVKPAERKQNSLLSPSNDSAGDDLLGGFIFSLIFHS